MNHALSARSGTSDDAGDWAAAAAADNARWCDSVCRAHGLAGRFSAGAWTSAVRTPPFYPDAVTLGPTVAAQDVLGAIDTSPGCSVKDSFATLDLTSAGFEVLFDASWIRREPDRQASLASSVTSAGTPAWTRVTEPMELAAIDFDVDFPAALLDDESVTVLGKKVGERWENGVIATRSDSVVGLSNLVVGDDPERAWQGATAAIGSRFSRLPIVGYERSENVEHAVRQGFTPIGPLRVWLKG